MSLCPDGEIALYLCTLDEFRVFFKEKIDTSSMKEILKHTLWQQQGNRYKDK